MYNKTQEAYKAKFASGEIESPGDVRPEANDPKWYLKWCEWIYARWCINATTLCPGGYCPSLFQDDRTVTELRQYGRGTQSVEKYREWLDVSSVKIGDKKVSLMNISFANNRIYTRFREIIIDMMMSVVFEPTIVAVDEPSTREKELKYAEDRFMADGRTKQIMDRVGVQMEGMTPELQSMTPDDVDVLRQLGGYQVAAEMALKEAVQASLQFSNFEPELKRMMCEDLVDLGIAAVETVTDEATGIQMEQYVDIAGLIMPQTQYDDCRDMDWVGYIKPMSISELRQRSDLDEDTLRRVMQQWRNTTQGAYYTGVNRDEKVPRGQYAQRFGSYAYDQLSGEVMTIYFIALDVERFVVGYRPEGNMIFDKVKRESKLNRRDEEKGKEVYDNRVQYVYKAQWIIGTDIVFNYGICDLVARTGKPGARRAVLPISVYRMNRPSITASCIGTIDDLQLAILKKRNAIARMPAAPNVFIDMAIYEDGLNLAGMQLSSLDLMEVYTITGILYGHSRSEFGHPGEASQRPPVQPLPDGSMHVLQSVHQEIASCVDMLRMISGVNEIADGSGNPRDVLNKVAQGMETATNRSISVNYTAMESLFKSICNVTARRYQALSAYGPRVIHYLPVHSDTARLLHLFPDFALTDLEISVRPVLDRESRQLFLSDIVKNRDAGMLDEATFAVVTDLVYQGNMARAKFVLAKAVQQRRMQEQQNQIALMQEQSRAQTEGQLAVTQAEAQLEELRLQGELRKIAAKGEEDRKTLELKLGIEQENTMEQKAVDIESNMLGAQQ